jgi:adenylate cyclase
VSESRRLAAILAADVVGFSRMANADEDRTLARLRTLRSELIDPSVASQNGRVFKRTGDGALIEFRSVVEAVRCAITVQNAMTERNAGMPTDQRIDFRIGIHLGDVVEESDGDLMGDGVNIAARLEGIAAPGAICLSEDAYRQVKGRLDHAVTDLGPTQLKNIAEPIRAYSLEVGKLAQAKPAPETKRPEPKKRSARAPLAAGIAGLLVVIALGVWYFLFAYRSTTVTTNPPAPVASNAAAPAEAAHLSIVVLPFSNLSNDPNQDYFADGVSENLTTELSRIRNSFVIARNTAFTFKGKNVDAKEIGKELAVRYVLEGSVQRDQNRVRINAQLIDAQSGAHLWADHFEEDIADLFKLQDQVVARLTNALGFQLVKAEADKSARSRNPDSVDLTMRGKVLVYSLSLTNESNLTAQGFFGQALKLDPNNADALAGEAWSYTGDKAFGWTKADIDYDAKILGQADRSIALDPDNVLAYQAKAAYLTMSSRPDEALRAADAGLAINPSSAILLATRANVETYLRRFEQAKSDLQQAMRLSPRDPRLGQWHNFTADAELGSGHFDVAIDESNKAIDAGYHAFYAYLNLAAAQALIGKIDEASTALAEARRLNPKLSVKWLNDHKPILQPAFDALRKAGLPEA